MAAAENGSITTVDLLIARHANVNACSISDFTALHHSAWSGNLKIACKLLDAGADLLSKDKNGLNASDHATRQLDTIYAEIFGNGEYLMIIPSKKPMISGNQQGIFRYFISYRHR